jgi:hypothetical protein
MTGGTPVYAYPAGTPYANIATDTVAAKEFQKIKLDGGGATLSVPITAGQKVAAQSLPVVLASDITINVNLPAGAATDAGLGAIVTAIGASNTLLSSLVTGQGTGNASLAAIAASNATIAANTTPAAPATATVSSVAAAIASTLLLAANAVRKGAMVYNDSAAEMYLKMGTGASATSFSVDMLPGSYYEVPYGYTGVLHGIWALATGSARVTELTA